MLFGVSVARPIGERMYWIQVGQDLAHRDVIIDDVVASFFPRVAWITFPILLLLLLIDIVIFRRALDPVREASTTAAAIGPQRTEVRLPEQAMPAEIAPLVHAVNQALDRLEAGFRAQRDFTADMAHELRTPLAIVRARVDSLEPGPVRDAAARRSRQHDAHRQPGARHRRARELHRRRRRHAPTCTRSAPTPWPSWRRSRSSMSKTIALTGAEAPVWVRGHTEALFRAVRNLVENAIRHTPAGVSIEVEVSADGVVRVLDDGPGVPEAERESIFRRFWRRDRAKADSRGPGSRHRGPRRRGPRRQRHRREAAGRRRGLHAAAAASGQLTAAN